MPSGAQARACVRSAAVRRVWLRKQARGARRQATGGESKTTTTAGSARRTAIRCAARGRRKGRPARCGVRAARGRCLRGGTARGICACCSVRGAERQSGLSFSGARWLQRSGVRAIQPAQRRAYARCALQRACAARYARGSRSCRSAPVQLAACAQRMRSSAKLYARALVFSRGAQ